MNKTAARAVKGWARDMAEGLLDKAWEQMAEEFDTGNAPEGLDANTLGDTEQVQQQLWEAVCAEMRRQLAVRKAYTPKS